MSQRKNKPTVDIVNRSLYILLQFFPLVLYSPKLEPYITTDPVKLASSSGRKNKPSQGPYCFPTRDVELNLIYLKLHR